MWVRQTRSGGEVVAPTKVTPKFQKYMKAVVLETALIKWRKPRVASSGTAVLGHVSMSTVCGHILFSRPNMLKVSCGFFFIDCHSVFFKDMQKVCSGGVCVTKSFRKMRKFILKKSCNGACNGIYELVNTIQP